jgi:hypothetical protein
MVHEILSHGMVRGSNKIRRRRSADLWSRPNRPALTSIPVGRTSPRNEPRTLFNYVMPTLHNCIELSRLAHILCIYVNLQEGLESKITALQGSLISFLLFA